MLSMQEEAMRRVREMQRRSQSYVSQDGSSQNSAPAPAPAPAPAAAEKRGSLLPFDLAGFDLDEEKALIGLLMYVLYKNSADMKLILALGYLLL